jgi:hypothetical protein
MQEIPIPVVYIPVMVLVTTAEFYNQFNLL